MSNYLKSQDNNEGVRVTTPLTGYCATRPGSVPGQRSALAQHKARVRYQRGQDQVGSTTCVENFLPSALQNTSVSRVTSLKTKEFRSTLEARLQSRVLVVLTY